MLAGLFVGQAQHSRAEFPFLWAVAHIQPKGRDSVRHYTEAPYEIGCVSVKTHTKEQIRLL